jgi:hypothetical protein
VAIAYYAPFFSEEIREKGFRASSLWLRVVTILILLVISWFIQYVVQDIIVAKLYGVYISHVMKRNTANKSGQTTKLPRPV